jgi:hypothetical protein
MKSGSNRCLSPPLALGSILLLLLEFVPGSLAAQPVAARIEPASTNAALASSVTFCAVTQGSGVFSYQWQKNGLNLPGQTNPCLTVTNVAISDGGSYRVTVFDAAIALESEEGLLRVTLNSLPGADQFASGTSISVVSNSVLGASFGATRELDEPLHFGLRTSNSVWYTWRAPASGIVTFDTKGSAFDTVLAVYVGDLTRLTEVASDDDGGGFHTSKVSWNALAGVDYHVVIDGVTGEIGDYVCNWNLEVTGAGLPVFTLKPRSQTVLLGGTAMFTAAATDSRGPLSFQWFHNGERIPGATSSNLTVFYVHSGHLGQYWLTASNSVERIATTPRVDLEIGPDPGVQSKDKIAEVPISGGGGGGFAPSSTSGGTFSLAAGTIINQRFFNGGTMDRCEPAHCGVSGGASRWFQLMPVSDGICMIDTLNSDVDTILAVYLQNFSICTNLYEPLVDCNNDVLGTCEQILAANVPRQRSSQLSFFATAGTIYRAVVDTVGGVRGTNIQFNVRFASSALAPTNTVQLGTSTNCLLQLRGSSVTLQVATNFTSPTNTYQWLVNGRRIAGAARDRLLLPFLNYSDAGRYAVTIQSGATRTLLPGAAVLVLDPCRDVGASNPTSRLVGASTESIILEVTGTLTSTSLWEAIGPIPPSIEPTLWYQGTGSRRFFRAVRPPP